MTRLHGTGREQGIALIWAILIMLVVLGTITATVGMSLNRADETKGEALRTRSSLWMDAASDDIVQRLQSREIGYLATVPTADNQDSFITVPTPGTQPAGNSARFPNGTFQARELRFVRSGKTYRGWYQVMPLPNTSTPWRARLIRSTPQDQGSIEMIVRAWEDGARAEPVVARLTFRHASFSRFALLSDDHLQLGGLGNVSPNRGFVHSNNARNQQVAITIEPPVVLNGSTITSTRGRIQASGSGCNGNSTCRANIQDVVEFGAGARAMDRVFQQHSQTIATNGASYRNSGISRYVDIVGNGGGTTMPVTVVNLGGCGAGHIQIGTGTFPLRTDTVGVPAIDDRTRFTGGGGQCYPVAPGGGTFLINGDVVVLGTRSDRRSVTIMAQRRRTFNVLVDLDGDGARTNSARVTMPASIFLDGATLGSTSAQAPVGLVAEGGVYAPSYNMLGAGTSMTINNVAAMASGGEIAYGPSIISVAIEAGLPSTDPRSGLGLSPGTARGLGFGYGNRLTWNGALASRRPIVFRYGSGGTYLGYGQRDFVFPPDLHWSAPAGYPSDRDWHLTDYKEFTR